MAEPSRDQSLSYLRWLIEAGADEAVLEEPVNRFRASSPPPRHSRTLERDSGTAREVRGESFSEQSPMPSPRGADKKSAAQAVSLSTAPGAARSLAQSCTTLAELKAALTNFDGCELKRYATNTVF